RAETSLWQSFLEGDILYFTNNDGSGIIHSKAEVKSVVNSEKLTVEESYELIEKKRTATNRQIHFE
ncbi:MAG: hypothetical protein IPH57_06985, partial [Saprospiraceae bacterium]|nr:hypothetical protein [Saprospiraceae bacterium]